MVTVATVIIGRFRGGHYYARTVEIWSEVGKVLREGHDIVREGKSWSTHDANLALYSTLTEGDPHHLTESDRKPTTSSPSTTKSKQLFLPPELVLNILDHHTRWTLTASYFVGIPEHRRDAELVRHCRNVYRPGYFSPKSVTGQGPFTNEEARQIRKIVFEFKGCRSHSPQHVRDGAPWLTHHEVVVAKMVQNKVRRKTLTFHIQWSHRPSKETEYYRYEYPTDIVSKLKKGSVIDMTICAPNWFLIQEVGMEMWSVDDLSKGQDMKLTESDILAPWGIFTKKRVL